jgi:hypothetical protein
MRKLKLFFACLLMAVLSIGQMWGAIDANSTWTATAFADIPDGATVVIINNFGNSFANATVTKAPAKVAASFNSTTKKITVSTTGKSLDDIAWTVEKATNGTKFWVYGSTTNLLGLSKTNDNNAVAVNTTSNAKYNEFVMGNNEKLLKYYNAGRYVGEYVSGSDWRSYNAENATNYKSGTTEQALTFYVLDAAPTDPFTVTLMDNSATLTEESAGAGVTLPSRDGCEGYTFVGWTNTWTAAQSSWTTEAPEIIPAGAYHPTADENLYPVYTKVEVSSGSGFTGYTQIELGGTITDGKYLISTGSFTMAGSGKTGASFTPGSTEKTEYEYTISVDNGKFTILGPDGKYIGGVNNTTLQFADAASDDAYHWTYASTGIQNVGTNTRHIKGYQTTDFRHYATSNGTLTYLYKRTEGGSSSTTYYISEPSCCTKRAISIATGITNGSISADLAEACEGVTVTITFSPAGGYHLDSWSVNGTAQNVNANTFLMPAAAATVSATFEHDPCDNLAAPTLDGEIAKTYNSATIAWNEVADAEAYAVSVVKDGESEPVFSGNVTELSKALENLEPETQYNYTIMAVGDGTIKCADGNGVLAGNFTTEPLPTAHLTLIDPSGTHASSGDYAILTPFNLPATAASCSKEFRGWDSNENCTTAPTYAKGAEFTFPNTTGVTLYAVYADELTPGTTSYVKTEFASLASGDNVVVTMDNGTGIFAMSNNEFVSNKGPKAVEVTVAANAITSTVTDAIVWDITFDESNFTLTVHNGTNKLYCLNDNNGLRVGTEENNVFSINSAYIHNNGQARFIGVYQSGDWRSYGSINANIKDQTLAFYKKTISEGTYGNYSTACVASPTATPASASIEVAATGGSSTLGVTYENVNLAGVTVALYNNAACTEAFDGGWLTAEIAGEDKHIAYTIAENTSYNDARTAYIKLTAPETTSATAPAVVVIPVSQAKKAAVFSSLEELVAADVNANTNVTVSFSNVVIKDIYYYNSNRRGLIFDIQKAGEDIKIYYNADVPAEWVAGGKVSGTLTDCPWKIYSGAWQLAPASGFVWATDLSYTAPKAVSSVVVSGNPSKDTYVDGEKFNPAGLTVTVNYNDATSEVNPTGVTFACDPVRVAKSDNPVSVSVVATFNEIDSDPFEVTGLTVGDIQTKTIAQFIEAGNADMRCYLEGIVSDIETGSKLKYGNFNLTDASGTIYVYGCLNQAGEAEHFEDLDVHNGDKIKVIAEDYDYYNTKHEAKNVQFVSKTPAATISIDDIDMETGDELALSSIVTTITPAAAESATISYEVTEGTAVSISEGKIIANAEGVATITASIAEGVGYLAANTTFTVTVTAPDTRKKAILNAPYTALNGDLSSTDIKYTTAQGGGTAVPAITAADKGSYIRLYKIASGNNYGGYITFNAVKGCKIDQVQITVGANASLAYCKDAEAIPTSGAESVLKDAVFSTSTGLDAESVTVVNLSTSNAFDVAAIKVYYNGDPLAVHHYILGGTYPTEFEQYGTFSYEGLTVTAAYNEQETITEPVSGFTVQADLMTAGNKKAEVYLGENKIAEYNITVNAATKENPALAYTPSEQTIAAENVASWSAPAFSNTFNVSPITYTSDKPAVATVDENGVIALAGGYGTAIITATFAEDDDYIASVATYTITVNEPVEDLSGTWVVAKSVAAGDRIIIGATYQGNTKTMGAQNDNNRAAVASTLAEGILTPAEGTKTFTLVDAGDGKFAIRALNGKYLTASGTGTKNYLTEADDYTEDNAKWTVSIDNEGVASIVALSNNRNDLQYNNGNTIFSCYATDGQKPVNIYKIGTPDYGSYQRTGLTAGNYGTICLPKAGTIEGATLFEIGSFENNKIYVDEVGTTLAAGVPYIFQATDDHLTVTYTSATVVETAGSANGLFGFYNLNDEDAQKNLDQNDGNYILYQNQYWLVSGRAAYIANYRAYIKISAIQNAQPAPGIRRVAMQVNGQNTTTGVDNLNAGETPVKVMINGQMFILRGEKMYNANGQLVK